MKLRVTLQPGAHRARALARAAALALAFAGCASPTVTPRHDTARVMEVRGSADYAWKEASGWAFSEAGGWGSAASARLEALKAFEKEQYTDALEGFQAARNLARQGDPVRVEATFYAAECLYHLGRYEEAVDLYRQLYRGQKPAESMLARTFERLRDIGLDYVNGRAACYFLSMSYECPGKGVDLLVGPDGLFTEYPKLSFADDTVFEIAKHYFDTKQFPEAVPLFERLVRDYPESEWRGPAEYYWALALFRQIRGVEYDVKIMQEAERRFRIYLEGNPRGPQAEEARANIREIMEMLALKLLRQAKFYLRESEPRAAEVYLRIVLDRYTNTEAAREAREIYVQIHDKA